MTRIELVRRAAAYLAGALCLWRLAELGIEAVRARECSSGAVLFAAVLGALAVGLFCMKSWARRFAAALCLLFAIFLPFGYINPFSAMDRGIDEPVSRLLLWIVPVVVGLLGFAWALDPPRVRSGRGLGGDQSTDKGPYV